MFRIGVDVGGTFTDLVVHDPIEGFRYFKTHSTPHNPAEGVLESLRLAAADYGLSLRELLARTTLLVHGTTVATNALIERKGATVGLVTTRGFRDILEMRESFKEDRYNLRMAPARPLVPRRLRVGVTERVRSDGTITIPLDEDEVRAAIALFEAEGVEAVAISFLFSFLDDAHERRVKELIAETHPEWYITPSSEVLPEIGEYPRVSTTVVNAYVGPVLARYLDRLAAELSGVGDGPEVLVMQSNGGVASIEEAGAQAVRCLMSGPAGGVSASAYLGRTTGLGRMITLDVGGTSTDISLIDGEPLLVSERFEAGWRIGVPSVDVQAIGAGGGSIASVDGGGILRVGPRSAGAVPGPASYGAGGEEATLTDAAVVLGILDPANFLGGRQPLDAELARRAIQRGVAEKLELSVEAAAAGTREVAARNIAEATRLMCLSHGTDPRRATLLAYGGASGLVATAVARALELESVVVPVAGPVLSALGMLSSDVKYDLSQSFPRSLQHADRGEIEAIFERMEAVGRARLEHGGVGLDEVSFERSVDLQYLDQVHGVTIPFPEDATDDAWRPRLEERFHERYEELYTYRQTGHEVRIVNLRLRAIGRLERVDLAQGAVRGVTEPTPGRRSVFLEGRWQDAPVYRWDALPADVALVGPAIIESSMTTVLLEAGDRATLDELGGIKISVRPALAHASRTSSTKRLDPITLAVLGRRLESIAREMSDVMARTAMSQILNLSHDYSTAILNDRNELIAQGEGSPGHISALPPALEAIRAYFGKDIHEGDVFILNDPFSGGSHLQDVTIVVPVFHGGRVLYFAVNRAHHVDIGGAMFGSYNPRATEIFQEGLVIPPLRLVERGRQRKDVMDLILRNVRLPVEVRGDLMAQVGSVRVAERRTLELLREYSDRDLRRYTDGLLSATESRVREFIGAIPDGTYRGETTIEDDGHGTQDIAIRVAVTVERSSLTIDFTGSSPEVAGFVNGSWANTRSMTHVAVMYLVPSDVEKNEGSFRPVTLIAPLGSIVNARHPHATGMSTNHPGDEIIDVIALALADALPGHVWAGYSRRLRYTLDGFNPATGRRFIWPHFMALGGGGACRDFDGWANVGMVGSAGAARSPSVEITEQRFPFLVRRHELRPDSGGAGKRRGGLGAISEIVFEGEQGQVTTAGEGVRVAPYGLLGGSAGLPHTYVLVSDGTTRVLGTKEANIPVRRNDVIIAMSAGGGGFGPLSERTPEDLERDLREGYVTPGGPA